MMIVTDTSCHINDTRSCRARVFATNHHKFKGWTIITVISYYQYIRLFLQQANNIMQQATPAPSQYHSSPPPPEAETLPVITAEDHPVEYPAPPQNIGSAPFYVLSFLFDKLQTERKPEKRRKILDSWFNVWHWHFRLSSVS
jgi:hypothetical protein